MLEIVFDMIENKETVRIANSQLKVERDSEYTCEECGIQASEGDIFYIAYDTEGDGSWSAYVCEDCSRLFS
ncbi:hypothetical protein [endosymbiont GvMRE of Glomus versiforme]|uniref:hypothetical protein n=1 Tax=endosymbiont GvMRE of Glomus versiforme TaxID=2039283 RepID=UPI0011C349E5|nr:hypothetical protein [endosymbiont GvMRE of Glomus versiforme]